MAYVWPALGLAAAAALWRLVRRRLRRGIAESEAVFVTGCDSGFGLHIVQALLEQTQAHVFAGHITEAGRARLAALGTRCVPLQLDVGKDEEVAAAFEAVRRSGKSLRGVVNNAGLGCYGYCETLSLEQYEHNLNVNFMGSVRVTKRALPLLRESRGRLVTMGSLACRQPSAFGSAYIPTKAALGAFQDCVRQEVYRFGVRCSMVEPGFFSTGMLHRAAVIGEQASAKPSAGSDVDSEVDKAYGSFAGKMKRTESAVRLSERLNGGERGVGRVSGAVIDALTTVCPMTHYLVGLDANILGRVGPLTPCWLIDLLQTYVI